MGVIDIIKQVVKIGGSLFPDYAIEMAKQLKNTNSLIIMGGGEFANLIRKYDSDQNFSAEVTHYTAIDCMDIISRLVNDKVDSARLAFSIDEINEISDEGYTPIFVVSDFLKKEDPFECSWDVTSDSIAAYVSHIFNANLFIVTNVNGIYTQDLLLRFGTNCYVVNGKFPERVLSLIDDNINDYNFDYTLIIGD